MKLPSIQFYPGDWLRDQVAGCSLQAQGLWLRMMFLMHDSTRYGYLCNPDGAPIPPDAIARRCGATPKEFDTLLAELDAAGVPSLTKGNVIFSRRMVRDAETRKQTAERVRKHRHKGELCNGDVTVKKHLSSSSSSSSDERLNVERLNASSRDGPHVNGHSTPNRSSPNRSQERELMKRLYAALGEDEMKRVGGHWRQNWVRRHPVLVDKALADLELQVKEKYQIDNRAAWLENQLQRWSK